MGTSFYLIYLFKAISKYNGIVNCCGLGLQYMNVGDTVLFITHTNKTFEFSITHKKKTEARNRYTISDL